MHLNRQDAMDAKRLPKAGPGGEKLRGSGSRRSRRNPALDGGGV